MFFAWGAEKCPLTVVQVFKRQKGGMGENQIKDGFQLPGTRQNYFSLLGQILENSWKYAKDVQALCLCFVNKLNLWRCVVSQEAVDFSWTSLTDGHILLRKNIIAQITV